MSKLSILILIKGAKLFSHSMLKHSGYKSDS